MVVGDIDLRVLLVPGRELLVDVRLDGAQGAVDKVDDARDAVFDVYCDKGRVC
jgi:hypothetical protein